MTATRVAVPLCGALLGAALALGARAQPFDRPPPPGPLRTLNIATPTEQRLPNGLRVVLAARPAVGLVTAQLVLLSGSETDPPRRTGLATLAAGLLTKGTLTRSASAQAREAESLGGALASSAGWNQSQVSITVTAPQLDPALALVVDAVMRPRFAQAELDRLRTQTLDGLKVAYAQPGTLAQLAADRLLFGAHPYGHPPEGTPASLPRITRSDVVGLHRQHYRPGNAVLVLAGDLEDATALQLAAKHFGRWKAAAVPPPKHPVPIDDLAPLGLSTRSVVIDMPKVEQAAVVFALPVPALGADRATAAVLNTVLGSDFSSRLNQEIRIQRGLSYGVGSQLDARRLGGALHIVVQTRNGSAAEVVTLVQTELDRLVAAPVPQAELAARKAALIGNFGRGIETTTGLANALRVLVVAGLPVSDLRHRIDALMKVTSEDIQRFADRHLGADGRRVVVAGDAAEFEAALRGTGLSPVKLGREALDLERDDGLTAR